MLLESDLIRSDTIVVGYDGSAGADAALEWAIGEVKLRGGSIHAVTAWHAHPMAPGEHARGEFEDAARAIASSARETLTSTGVGGDAIAIEGRPVDVLIDASRMARMLVVGAGGRGWLPTPELGSVSAHCAHNAACPVMIVRPER